MGKGRRKEGVGSGRRDKGEEKNRKEASEQGGGRAKIYKEKGKWGKISEGGRKRKSKE